MRTFLQSMYVKNLNRNSAEAVLFLNIGKGSRSHDRVYLQGIFANGPLHHLLQCRRAKKPFVDILAARIVSLL